MTENAVTLTVTIPSPCPGALWIRKGQSNPASKPSRPSKTSYVFERISLSYLGAHHDSAHALSLSGQGFSSQSQPCRISGSRPGQAFRLEMKAFGCFRLSLECFSPTRHQDSNGRGLPGQGKGGSAWKPEPSAPRSLVRIAALSPIARTQPLLQDLTPTRIPEPMVILGLGARPGHTRSFTISTPKQTIHPKPAN